jgi:hypothetical protein
MRLRDLYRDRIVWLFTALTLGYFFRPLTTETFYFRDLYRLFYAKKLFLSQCIRAGIVPLWDPLTAGGQPYLATPSNFFFHPSNLLYAILPPLEAFNVVLVLHVLVCALAAYWLARVVGLPLFAAAITGGVFAFSGYTLSTANLTPLLLGMPWIPLTLGLTHRALRDKRSIAPACIAAAMPLYSAAAELSAMLFATLIVWVLAARLPSSKRARGAAAAIVIGFAIALSLMQTLPALSVIRQSSRSEKRSYETFAEWSVNPRRLPELVVPRFFGETNTLSETGYWGRPLETLGFPYILSIYVGFPALLLACIGACKRLDVEVPTRALAGLAAAGLLFSLGGHLPFFRFVYDHVPLIGIFRYPVKAQIIALLPIALLAGCGAHNLECGGRAAVAVAWPPHSRSLAIGFAFVACLLAIGVAFSSPFATSFAHAFSFAPLGAAQRALLARSLVHATLAALALALARRPVALATVVLCDLAIAGFSVNHYAPRAIFDEPPIAAAVRRVIGDGRFYSPERKTVLAAPADDLMWLARWQLATLDGYNAALFGIPVIYHKDYDGLAPKQVAKLSAALERMTWEERRPWLNAGAVRAFITTDVVPGYQELGSMPTPGGRLRLYLNPSASSERFEPRHPERSRGTRARGGEMSAPSTHSGPSTTLGMTGVLTVRRSNDDAAYEVDAPADGLVIFSEPHYEGWTATVDAKPVPHRRADYAFTAVPVERGHHVIERRYWPPLLNAGIAATFAAAILLAFVSRFTS